MMLVAVNGAAMTFAPGDTLVAVLDALGAPRSGVAVARNGGVVPRGEWASTALAGGDVIEVLQVAQGG